MAFRKLLNFRMFRDHTPGRIAWLLAALLITSCAVGPNFDAPDAPEVDRYTPEKISTLEKVDGVALQLESGRAIPEKWWGVFHNKEINRIIEAAIAHNQTLEAAEAAIRIAYFNAESQKGLWLPNVGAISNDSINLETNFRAYGNINPVIANQLYPTVGNVVTGIQSVNTQNPATSPYNLFLKQVQVSYFVDIWGKNRRSVEALEAQVDLQRYQLEAAYLAMTSNVVLTAILEASLRSQYMAIEKMVSTQKSLLEVLRKQFKEGWASKLDVLTQEALYAQTLQQLPPLQKQIAFARNLLTALAGDYSTAQLPPTFDLSQIKGPAHVPLSLPSDIVRQRPDIRAAEANLHAAAAQIGVAIAARLPKFVLGNTPVGDPSVFGYNAYHFSELFAPGTQFYSLASNVAQPVFAGYSLLNQQKAAEASFDLAAAQYRESVIAAFQNVADMLRALQADTKAVQAAIYSEEVSKKQLDIMQAEAKIGAVSILLLLNAQSNYLMATVSHAAAEGNRLADIAGLFMALGGGWSDQVLRKLPPNRNGARFSDEVAGVKAPVNPSLVTGLPDNPNIIPRGSWNPSLIPDFLKSPGN